jgi:hypothetical protein
MMMIIFVTMLYAMLHNGDCGGRDYNGEIASQ